MIRAILEDVDPQDVGGEGILRVTAAAGGAVLIPTLIVMTVKAHAVILAEEEGTKTTWFKQ